MKESFREIMLRGVRDTGMSLAELSRRSGVSYDVLNKVKRRPNSSTSAENAAAVLRALGVPPEDMVGVELAGPRNGNALVPVYDVAASAGPGAYVDYEIVAERLSFPPDYLRRITSTPPDRLAIISVKGDSMEPTLKDGDIVMVDGSKTSPGFDGLFVLHIDGALHVKRLARTGKPGVVLVRSDNERNYPAYEARGEDITIIGKVLWSGRKE